MIGIKAPTVTGDICTARLIGKIKLTRVDDSGFVFSVSFYSAGHDDGSLVYWSTVGQGDTHHVTYADAADTYAAFQRYFAKGYTPLETVGQ